MTLRAAPLWALVRRQPCDILPACGAELWWCQCRGDPSFAFSDARTTVLDPIHDECGVAAVYRTETPLPGAEPGEIYTPEQSVIPLLPDMLIDLQNRGQLAAGLTRYSESAVQLIDTHRDVGSVSDVFRLTLPDSAEFQAIMERYAGRAGIGHTRYATCGKDDRSLAQPFEVHHGRRWKWFAFCFNGNVSNYAELRDQLVGNGYHLVRESDTEILMHHLCYALEGDTKPTFERVFEQLAHYVDGAFSMAFLNADGDLVLARDPRGFRPLCYGMKGNLFAAASESVALKNRGFEKIYEVEPGHLVHVTSKEMRSARFAPAAPKAFCFFEKVYFANVASNLGGQSVYLTRTRLGEALAATETLSTDPDDCVAVPVPDTAKAACDGMAYRLGIPSREGLIRNRYVGRTFIEGRNRKERVMRKFTALPEVLEGKRVILIDDSVVRSTTLRVIVNMLREQGRAKEVHVRVACPPIMAPCFYGIDMSTIGELFAASMVPEALGRDLSEAELQKLSAELGTDSLRYLTVDQLVGALRHDDEQASKEPGLCLGCLTGQYPTEWGNRLYKAACRANAEGSAGRTYESAGASSPVCPAPSRGVSQEETPVASPQARTARDISAHSSDAGASTTLRGGDLGVGDLGAGELGTGDFGTPHG